MLCDHSGSPSISEPLSSLFKKGKAQLLPGVVGVGVHCGLGGCPPLHEPSYHETWGSQEDTEAAAVDGPRSQALRSLKRNQLHLILD